jgi:hypothetical protein
MVALETRDNAKFALGFYCIVRTWLTAEIRREQMRSLSPMDAEDGSMINTILSDMSGSRHGFLNLG